MLPLPILDNGLTYHCCLKERPTRLQRYRYLKLSLLFWVVLFCLFYSNNMYLRVSLIYYWLNLAYNTPSPALFNILLLLSQYFFAFNSVGLGSLIGNVFIALALSIGLYIKDPISDFISYFIILVQRPVKIGDYVKLMKIPWVLCVKLHHAQ